MIDKLKHLIANILEKIGKFLFRGYDKTYSKRLSEMEAVLDAQSKELTAIRYMLTAMQPTEPNRPHPHIVVSLTTFPARITAVSNVIENMLAQSVVPDKVVLYLSEQNFPNREEDMPLRLLRLRSNRFEIRWVKDDLRSFKKIIPALQDFADDIVITVDDDLTYPSYLIEKLVDAHQKFPNAICGVRTHQVGRDGDGRFLPYKQWNKSISHYVMEPRWDLMATTGAGTLFPPHVFDNTDFFDKDAIRELCPTADDMWVKFMSMKHNIPVVLAMPVEKLKYIPDTQEERLWTTNITANDTQFNALLERYGTGIWDKMEH